MSTPCSLGIAAEHALLLRHWAGVQARVSWQACEQAHRCAALETEVVRWRARWMIATTQMLWGLGWPGASPVALQGAPRMQASEAATATAVICQTGCAGHAHPWRGDLGECRLTGDDCTRVPPAYPLPMVVDA